MRASAQLAWLQAAIQPPRRADRIAVVAIVAVAAAIAWLFAAAVLVHTRPMGLPLDDSYAALACARQIGRGQLLRCTLGGAAPAVGSPLGPVLLAPFWTLGAHGHALVWVAFALSAVLHAATALGVFRIVQRIAGRLAGVSAALIALGVAASAWSALSGVEVALGSALEVALILRVVTAPDTGAPGRWLAACLAATALSWPDGTVIAVAVAGIACAGRVRRRELRAAGRWLVPLAPVVVWLVAQRWLSGHWLPGAAVVRSHVALPGFDGTYWRQAVWMLSGRVLRGVFWDAASPLPLPRVLAALWLVGAARVVAWAVRERRWLAGAAVVASPLAVLLAVVASSGLWSFQNHRAIAPAFPLLAVVCGCALGPLDRGPRLVRRIHGVARALWIAGLVAAALPRLVADARLFAQGAADTNAGGVAVGEYLRRKLPGAGVIGHDLHAIAYGSDGDVVDLAGPSTGVPAGVDDHGPGARFEFLEGLLPAQRPGYFTVASEWLGTSELFGEDVFRTRLGPRFEPRRLAGDPELGVLTACWDHVGTGERPLSDHTGWSIVDRIDVADLASEAAHHWRGELGRRSLGDPPARWSVIGREAGAHGLVLDGGRTIRGGSEQFEIAIDPARPVRLVLRTGGARAYLHHELIEHAAALRILDDAGRELARATLPAPSAAGSFAEVAFTLPAGTSPVLHTEASTPYRAFHWFVLQPE